MGLRSLLRNIRKLFIILCKLVIPSTPEADLFLYAHSMGGGIASLFLEAYTEYFEAAVLNAPMMEVNTSSVPEPLASGIAKFMRWIGRGESYILGHGPYEGIVEHNESAYSQARVNHYEEMKASNEVLQLGGGSFTWLDESLEVTDKMQENAKQAITPILLFQADEDTYVLPEGHYIFASDAPNTQLVFVENSQHEIYLSNNDILIPYYNTIFEFFEVNKAQ